MFLFTIFIVCVIIRGYRTVPYWPIEISLHAMQPQCKELFRWGLVLLSAILFYAEIEKMEIDLTPFIGFCASSIPYFLSMFRAHKRNDLIDMIGGLFGIVFFALTGSQFVDVSFVLVCVGIQMVGWFDDSKFVPHMCGVLLMVSGMFHNICNGKEPITAFITFFMYSLLYSIRIVARTFTVAFFETEQWKKTQVEKNHRLDWIPLLKPLVQICKYQRNIMLGIVRPKNTFTMTLFRLSGVFQWLFLWLIFTHFVITRSLQHVNIEFR